MLEPEYFDQVFPHQYKHGKYAKSIIFLERDYVIKTCDIETLSPELDAYCQIKHKYMPKIYGWTYDSKSAYLSIAMERGSPISSRQPTELRKIAKMLVQICKYIHSKNRIHGDIKIDNIIMIQGVYKLIDWELSKIGFLYHGEVKYLGPSGTVTFKDFDFDPEVPYTSAVDIYSIGKTLSVLISGEAYTSLPASSQDSELNAMIKDCMCQKSFRLSAVDLEKKYSWLNDDSISTSCSSSSVSYSIFPSDSSHSIGIDQKSGSTEINKSTPEHTPETKQTNISDEKKTAIMEDSIKDLLDISKKISLDLKCLYITLYNIGRFWNNINTKDISSYILANLIIGSSMSQYVVFSIEDIDHRIRDAVSLLTFKILGLCHGCIDVETSWNSTSLNTLKDSFNNMVEKTIMVLNSKIPSTEYVDFWKLIVTSKIDTVCLGPYTYYSKLLESGSKLNDIKEYQFPGSSLDDWNIEEYGPSFIYGFIMKLNPQQQEVCIDEIKRRITAENKDKYIGLLDIIETTSEQKISFSSENSILDLSS